MHNIDIARQYLPLMRSSRPFLQSLPHRCHKKLFPADRLERFFRSAIFPSETPHTICANKYFMSLPKAKLAIDSNVKCYTANLTGFH